MAMKSSMVVHMVLQNIAVQILVVIDKPLCEITLYNIKLIKCITILYYIFPIVILETNIFITYLNLPSYYIVTKTQYITMIQSYNTMCILYYSYLQYVDCVDCILLLRHKSNLTYPSIP